MFFWLLLLFLPFVSQAQNPNQASAFKIVPESEVLKTAETYLAQGDSYSAFLLLEKAIRLKKYKNDKQAAYLYGVAAYERGFLDKSFKIFEKLEYKKQKTNILYYLARIYHEQEKYKEANVYYRLFLKAAAWKHPFYAVAKAGLHQLGYLPSLQMVEARGLLSEIESPLNTVYDESNLQKFPRADTLYFFDSNRPVAQLSNTNPNIREKSNPKSKKKPSPNPKDISIVRIEPNLFSIHQKEANWETTQALKRRYNSDKNEFLLGFMDEGYQILYAQNGQTLVDNYDEDTLRLAYPFAPELWDCMGCEQKDYFFWNDKTLIFASNRSGGFDLYWSVYQADSSWSAPMPLGGGVNTEGYDERCGFLAVDGLSLYFSSNRPQSMGGFDVYKSEFLPEAQAWTSPELLGKPINSTRDDLFFRPQTDGISAYFSSNRAGGLGGMDIYGVYFPRYLPEQERKMQDSSLNFVQILQKNAEAPRPIVSRPNQPNSSNLSNQPEQAQFVLPNIFYTGLGLDPNQVGQAGDILLQIFKICPNCALEISTHTDNSGDAVYDLYLSLKQSDAVAKQLIEKGVDAEKISLRGYAQNFPIARNTNPDGSPNPQGQQLNRRVEFRISQADTFPAWVSNQPIIVSEVLQPNRPYILPAQYQGTGYKLELRQANGFWRNDFLRANPLICTEQAVNQASISYMYGYETSQAAIQRLYDELLPKFPNLKIITYRNGQRLD